MKKDIIFWDVDTQFDFMRPEGKLYVAGAENIIAKVSEVRKFALGNGYSIVADVDWHKPDNKEISNTPDFKETFPPHCMAGEPGNERVGFLGDLPIDYIQIDKMDTEAIQKLICKEQFHIVIRKASIDVFSNCNTVKLVELINPKKVVVFGVALDFCVYYVMQGLNRFPDIQLCLIKDVVKGLGVKPEHEILDEFKEMGVEITELSVLKRKLQCG